ncbi:MAG: carotenoid 1,2-hydratase [Paracoccaceae bacterium]
MSNDNSKAISIIAFIGSVFSPWYRWYGRKNPHDHCCINVATYGHKGRWTMTERGEPAVLIKDNRFQVGPSSFNWDRNKLVVEIDELTTPHLSRLKGQVIIEPKYITDIEVLLKDDGSHIWRPFAPISNIQVDLNVPGWQWSGHGYLDGNFGTRALEDDFSYWTWSRLIGKNGAMAFYDAKRRESGDLDLGLEFNNDGNIKILNDIPKTKFSRSLWQVRRETRSDNEYKPKQIQNMLDAPFYSRSKIKTKIKGEEVEGVHEALDLNRFANPLIKPMLALRVPRKRG